MAFSATVTAKTVMGNKRVHMGTIAQVSGDTGGAVTTGLRSVDSFTTSIHCTTLSVSGGTVTITTADPGAAQAGYFTAIGY